MATVSTTNTKKWVHRRLAIRVNKREFEKIERYCEQTGRNINDVVRELIRGLPD